jgi:hypothetical protein
LQLSGELPLATPAARVRCTDSLGSGETMPTNQVCLETLAKTCD